MYLSKLSLDPRSRQVQAEISNRYELHRTLTAQFSEEKREKIGLLYRVELPNYNNEAITLLVQSQLDPSWDGLLDAKLLINQPEIKSFDVIFSEGSSYYFRLLANPTIRRSQTEGKGKRVGLYTPQEQQDWLFRKADQGGFKIIGTNLLDLGFVESIKRKHNRTYAIKQLAVQFDGLLKVCNPEKFTAALINGIGSAKAFGFGLLSLAKE